jgi:hypothetical protein
LLFSIGALSKYFFTIGGRSRRRDLYRRLSAATVEPKPYPVGASGDDNDRSKLMPTTAVWEKF